MAGEIWLHQVEAIRRSHEELVQIAVRLRMRHRNPNGNCDETCQRCEGERLYDAMIARATPPSPNAA